MESYKNIIRQAIFFFFGKEYNFEGNFEGFIIISFIYYNIFKINNIRTVWENKKLKNEKEMDYK